VNNFANRLDDRRMLVIVTGKDHPLHLPGVIEQSTSLFRRTSQRFLAQNVQASREGRVRNGRMIVRRSRDIDEIELRRLRFQQIVIRAINSSFREGSLGQGPAAYGNVGEGDDSHVV